MICLKCLIDPCICQEINKEISTPISRQVGGSHYKDFPISPAKFVTKNKFGYLQESIIYRICRYNKKGTPLEDLEKAIHEIELLIEIEGLRRNL